MNKYYQTPSASESGCVDIDDGKAFSEIFELSIINYS